jgi:class 3 adenylate cyclase
MKTILNAALVILGLLAPFLSLAQSNTIQDLESKLRSVAGVERIETFIALADAYIQAGDYDKAQKYAEAGTDLAQRMQRSNYEAISLNREGKILAITGKRGLFGKDRAAAKFRESNQLLKKRKRPNKDLFIDNLTALRNQAQKYGREDELLEIDEQLARAKNLINALPGSANFTLEKPLTRQELQEELTVITDQLLKQQKVENSSSVQRLNYERERQQLQAELKEQEKFIDQMTENQMKAALLLMQHRNKLDSLEYRTELDELNVTNAQLAVQEANSKRNFYLAAMVAMLFLAGGAVFSYLRARQTTHLLRDKNKIIRAEQKRSEDLLLNILPALVAEELKKRGSTSARYFEDVSVLFADFVGFSKIAEILTPQELVSELDTCFKAFDDIIAKYNLEKIKTIGDAYMAAGGLPNGGGSQLRDMVNAALEMQEWLLNWNIGRRKKKLPIFEARIGIHRGPVVAGVVGSKKFAFDIWGDTVNIASRIESAGEGGKINISGEVYKVIHKFFPCHYRGKIPAKNKGEIDMYFVEN